MRIITGTITNGVTLSATDGPVLIGGLITNDGTGANGAVYGGAGIYADIRNVGTVGDSSATFAGILLNGAGTITNGAPTATLAAIRGSSYGLKLAGTSSVTNYGTISGGFAGARLLADGRLVNGSAADTTALISGGGGEGASFGEFVSTGFGTVVNFGTIVSSRFVGVDIGGSGGLLINGSIADTQSLVSGYGDGIRVIRGAGTVSNFGTITATIQRGIAILGAYANPLNVTNGSSTSTKALISATYGIHAASGSTITNFATITGTGLSSEAVQLGGGTVVNGSAISKTALIQADFAGLYFSGTAKITNFGRMEGSAAGILLTTGGTIVNGSSVDKTALIGNGIDGIDVSGAAAATITNFGTIKGVVSAVLFGDGADKLIVEPTGKFIGSVNGGAGTDTATFVGGGALATSNFSGFEKISLSSTLADTLTLTLTLTNANFANVTGAQITVTAGAAGDTVNAAAVTGANRLVFFGGAGNDTIFASDMASLKGGAGTNKFTFDDVGTRTITDFGVSATNQLIFRDSGFNLGTVNEGHGTATALHLNSAAFVASAGGTFTNTSQRFAFNTTTGVLNYDANGSGSGSTAHRVVTLTGNPTLSAGASGNIFFTS